METLIVNLGISIPKDMESKEMEDKLVMALATAGIDATIEIIDRK